MPGKHKAKRKYARQWNEKWELIYFFTEGPNNNALCLICNETVSELKGTKLERHFVSKHELYNTKYPLDSTTRKIKYDSLKSCLEKQKNLFQQMSSSVDCESRASNMVSWILARNLKPFTDGEIIKECMIEASKFLFPNDKKIHDKFQSMHLSARTVTRKIEKMVVNVYEQLSNNLSEAEFVSIALDESTDLVGLSMSLLTLSVKHNSVFMHVLSLRIVVYLKNCLELNHWKQLQLDKTFMTNCSKY